MARPANTRRESRLPSQTPPPAGLSDTGTYGSGATASAEANSVEPADVAHRTLDMRDTAFGSTLNAKGYRVLEHVRVIQGDGVNPDSIHLILEHITHAGYATDNIASGWVARCCRSSTATPGNSR